MNKRLSIAAAALATATIAAPLTVSGAPAVAVTSNLGLRAVNDGCPGTVLSGSSYGTARLGSDPAGVSDRFRTSVSVKNAKPFTTYRVHLAWQDAATPQECRYLGIGQFKTGLLGSGTFGIYTSEYAFRQAFPASSSGDFNVWVEARPFAGSSNVLTLVSGSIACEEQSIGLPKPLDCPAY